jgi:hypothetical protein
MCLELLSVRRSLILGRIAGGIRLRNLSQRIRPIGTGIMWCRKQGLRTGSSGGRCALRNVPTVSRGTVHSHPRAWNIVKRDYREFQISTVKQFSDVLDVASVYVADSTSTLYEFAYTGKPVVVVNSTKYRRHMNHGLRFWDYIPGMQVDHWKDLVGAVERALDGEGEELRARAVDVAYPIRDGTSARRAADALCDLL